MLRFQAAQSIIAVIADIEMLGKHKFCLEHDYGAGFRG